MDTIYLQAQRKNTVTCGQNQVIIFDDIISQFEPADSETLPINLDLATGVITFNVVGIYLLEWVISTNQVLGSPQVVSVSLESPGKEAISFSAPIRYGQACGNAIIEVDTPGMTMLLRNMTGSLVFLTNTVAADLLIYSVDTAGVTGPTGPTGMMGPTGMTGATGATVTIIYGK
ncbi:MAG: hypothetical protein LBV33_03865 [Lachnospiraceae bacterium]|jgi:hypothetical protein|nr:hypothetical protein [Lachnospiraceae bacterium]